MYHANDWDCVFQYRYSTGRDLHRHGTFCVCVLVSTPFDAPYTAITGEGFVGAIGRAVGARDIEIESSAFNRRFRVESADERFAVTLLDPRFLAWLSVHVTDDSEFRLEFFGPVALRVYDDPAVDPMPQHLQWMKDMRANLPAVLGDAYPGGLAPPWPRSAPAPDHLYGRGT